MESGQNERNEPTARIEIWVIDHLVLDMLVSTTTGRTIRPWLTTFIDLMSGRTEVLSLTAGESELS